MILDPFMFVQQIWALLKYLRFARFDYTDLCCIPVLVWCTRFGGNKNEISVQPHICKHAVFMFASQARWIRFRFHSFSLRNEYMQCMHVYTFYLAKWERSFSIVCLRLELFYGASYLVENALQPLSIFCARMKSGNHLTSLTSKILHSHVNLTQKFFIFPSSIMYLCVCLWSLPLCEGRRKERIKPAPRTMNLLLLNRWIYFVHEPTRHAQI